MDSSIEVRQSQFNCDTIFCTLISILTSHMFHLFSPVTEDLFHMREKIISERECKQGISETITRDMLCTMPAMPQGVIKSACGVSIQDIRHCFLEVIWTS